jgi:hypothetical protein
MYQSAHQRDIRVPIREANPTIININMPGASERRTLREQHYGKAVCSNFKRIKKYVQQILSYSRECMQYCAERRCVMRPLHGLPIKQWHTELRGRMEDGDS